MAIVVCPQCNPMMMYSGPIVWKPCESCAQAATQQYGQGRFGR